MFNRSIICKTANKLRKNGYTLSQAFRMSWKLAKAKAVVKVAGVSIGNRQRAIEHLREYALDSIKVTLTREKANTHDSNAIAVNISVNASQPVKVGYIPAPVASLLSGVMDTISGIKASVQAITGGYYEDMYSGLRLSLSF